MNLQGGTQILQCFSRHLKYKFCWTSIVVVFGVCLCGETKKKSLVVPDVMKAVKIVPVEPLSCRVSFACFCFYSAL